MVSTSTASAFLTQKDNTSISYSAENVSENPIASSHGIEMQTSAPAWSVTLMSMLRGMSADPEQETCPKYEKDFG